MPIMLRLTRQVLMFSPFKQVIICRHGAEKRRSVGVIAWRGET
jgi:hypothetical protein